SLGKLLLRAKYAVIGERLHLLVEADARRVDPGGLALRRRRQDPHIPAAASLPCELQGAQDVGAPRDVCEARVGVVPLGHSSPRVPPDAAAIEELGLSPVEAPVVAPAAAPEIED